MNNRPGVTLMEVLVAIFIMGIGMLAMLVLFPLGVLRMSQSLQDERCAQASRMATAIASFQGLRNDPWVLFDPNFAQPLVVTITNSGAGYAGPTFPVTFSANSNGATGNAVVVGGQVVGVTMTSYGAGFNNTTAPITVDFSAGGGAGAAAIVSLADSFTLPGTPGAVSTLLPANPHGPSYPVFVDPMGYFGVQGQLNQFWLAGLLGNSNTIPRRTASYTLSGAPLGPDSGLTLRWTCLLDELPFSRVDDGGNLTGTPQLDLLPNPPNQAGAFTRDIRYCWAYMLRRPRTADHSVVDMSVVVYNYNRPILSSLINEYLFENDPANPANDEVFFDPIYNTITLETVNKTVPPCRPGDWLLDASYVPDQTGKYATVNGYFYRVVGVSQNTDTNFTFEVQQPLRNMPATMAALGTQKIIFLEGVAEVFEKGPGRLP